MRRTGVADDKAVYSYMPAIVEFYTGEKAILKNVETHRCAEPEALKYVLDNLADLVVKEVHGSGGYGMLVGPAASKSEIAAFATKLKERPGNYIAQPTLSLSTVPIFTEAGLAPRHVDLRPFALVSPNGGRNHTGRAYPRGTDRRQPRGQFKPGRRNQGHMGVERLTCWEKPQVDFTGCFAFLSGQRIPRAL